MARYLQQLLDAREPLFSLGLTQLEKATGYQGIDVALIGDIHAKAHAVLRLWKLDPADSTPDEIYQILQAHADDRRLRPAEYAGLVTPEGVISFNPNDVKRNAHRDFADRTLDTLKARLVEEIVRRYEATGRLTRARVEEVMKDAGVAALLASQTRKKKENL
jgi:hypothetical protein